MAGALLSLATGAARTARRLRRATLVGLPAQLSVVGSLVRQPFQPVACWTDPTHAVRPDVALFVHYDPDGNVAPRVLRYLDALETAGLSVLFVSNAGCLRPEAMAAVQAVCAAVLVRRNVGYDFGAMREALFHWQLPHPGTRMVLLVNDSVLGPFGLLRPVLDRIDFAAADVWGATDSLQRGYHLQSWFLAASRRALDSPGWNSFWSGVRPVQNKEWVIGHYEVAFTQAMQAGGLRLRALWPYKDVLRRFQQSNERFTSVGHVQQLARTRRLLSFGYDLNPTADLWRQLLEAGCPFVKRELIGRNPARVADAADWRMLVGHALT